MTIPPPSIIVSLTSLVVLLCLYLIGESKQDIKSFSHYLVTGFETIISKVSRKVILELIEVDIFVNRVVFINQRSELDRVAVNKSVEISLEILFIGLCLFL